MADKFPQEPKTGGVTHHDPDPNVPKSEGEIFNTSGNQPVRDRKADPSKGFPVTRLFTKDGTPVEPGSIPGKPNPANEPNFEARPDVIQVVEYTNKEGEVITHDMLKKQREDESRKDKQEDQTDNK